MSDSKFVSGDVTFRDLQILLSVASTGSFRSAASRMFTSQPAISRSIARLEHELGVSLLERGPRGAQLTAAGVTVVEHARRIGGMMTTLRKDLTEGPRARIRLGAAATAAGSYLAPFLAQWIPAHLDVEIEVIEDGAVKLRERLADGECDLAIVPLPVGETFEAEPLAHLSVCAYFPAGHPLDTGDTTITVDELVPHSLVVNNTGFLAGRVFMQECEASGLFPRIVYRSNVGQTLAALAEAGLGVAVFGDTVDMRGFDLRSRQMYTREGQRMGFALAVAWHRRETPDWIRAFGTDLAVFARTQNGG
ncbi:MAG TPA: LysR family transcriptional regulator [Candidatus Stackebrandtia faecavium]|nr:LysR family transcriptional regulator [Candidatus Stackebrandtia faecavium]